MAYVLPSARKPISARSKVYQWVDAKPGTKSSLINFAHVFHIFTGSQKIRTFASIFDPSPVISPSKHSNFKIGQYIELELFLTTVKVLRYFRFRIQEAVPRFRLRSAAIAAVAESVLC